MKTHRAILAAALPLGVVALAAGVRGSLHAPPTASAVARSRPVPPVPEPPAADAAPARLPDLAPRPPASPLEGFPETFWEGLGVLLEARLESDPAAHRESVMAETVRYLGLDSPRAEIFHGGARQALREIEQAWVVREEGWVAVSSNPVLEDATREQVERVIQERYEAAKQGALARVRAALGDTPRAGDFGQRLEEWIDALR